jgi:hypothetical protein
MCWYVFTSLETPNYQFIVLAFDKHIVNLFSLLPIGESSFVIYIPLGRVHPSAIQYSRRHPWDSHILEYGRGHLHKITACSATIHTHARILPQGVDAMFPWMAIELIFSESFPAVPTTESV